MKSGIPMIAQDNDERPILDFGCNEQFSAPVSRHEKFQWHLLDYPRRRWPAAIHWIAPAIKEK